MSSEISFPQGIPPSDIWADVVKQAPLTVKREDINVSWKTQGNFTIVLVTRSENSRYMFVGITKRNCKLDKRDDEFRARANALGRALMPFRTQEPSLAEWLAAEQLSPEMYEAISTEEMADIREIL